MAAKWLKSIPYVWPKRLKNYTLWGRTYLYSPYKGVPPPPVSRRHVGALPRSTDTSNRDICHRVLILKRKTITLNNNSSRARTVQLAWFPFWPTREPSNVGKVCLSLCLMGCVRFARYCGKIYKPPSFSYGGLNAEPYRDNEGSEDADVFCAFADSLECQRFRTI